MSKEVNAQFIYAGHTMGLVFANMGNGWHVASQSIKAEPIEGGTYPKHFAEGEAIDAITNLTMNDKNLNAEDVASVEASTRNAIARLIADGTFQAVN